jgi:RHS repeat-associated protein
MGGLEFPFLNEPPVANAGPDQSVARGVLVTLDGTQSQAPEGAALTFGWTLVSQPAGSSVSLNNSTSATPQFTPLRPGNYVFELVVNDGQFDSAPDSVTVTADNANPTANAGGPYTGTVNVPIQFSGTGNDPEGDGLTFSWDFGDGGTASGPSPTHAYTTADVFTVTLTVSDPFGGIGTSQTTATVTPPLVLDPIGNKTVNIGSTLSFTMTASGGTGSLSFSVSPLPLPANSSFNSATGLFSFSPDLSQVSSLMLTFSVTEGTSTDSETITITIPQPDPAGVTAFTGRVLDANDFDGGTTTPVVGATISFLGTGQAAVSDAQGNFTVNNLPAGSQILDIDTSTANPAPDGSPYAGFREELELLSGVNNDIDRPFFLPRISVNSLITVDPNTTTVVTNADLRVTLTIPPNTAKDQNGNDFTGQISISLVPRGLAPAALPEELDPGLLITIQPVGVTFATPVPITFPNIDNFPAGNEADLWSLDANTGTFNIVGTMEVSADGTQLDTISGGIMAADWHAPMPPEPAGDNGENNPDDDDCPCGLRVGGVELLGELFTNTTGLSESIDETFHQAVQFDANSLPTGRYPYRLSLTSNYISSSISTFLNGQVIVNNRSQSPLGAGWTLEGLQRIHVQADGSVLLTQDNGSAALFRTDRALFVSGFNSGNITRVDLETLATTTVVTGLSNPEDGVCGSDGRIYFAESLAARMTRFNQDGSDPTPMSTTPVGGLAQNAEGLVIDAAGNLYFNTRGGFFIFPGHTGVWRIDADPLANQPDPAAAPVNVIPPFSTLGEGTAIAANGDILAVAFNEGKVVRWDSGTGTLDSEFITGLVQPLGIAVDNAGNIYFSEVSTGKVSKFTDSGLPLGEVVSGLQFASYVEVDRAGNVYVADFTANQIVKVDPEGNQTVIPLPGGPVGLALCDPSLESTPVQFNSPPGDFTTLVKNDDGTFTRTLKDGTKINFNSVGLQTSVVDRNGNTTSYTYNPDDTLATITDPVGLVTSFTHTGGKLSSITDSAGRVTQFTVDAIGDLTQITDPDGSITTYTYDAQHLVTTQTNPRNLTTSYQYNFAARISQSSLPDGSTRLFSPSVTVGLTDPTSGQGTESNPAPVVRPIEAVSTITDGNENTTTFETNKFGAATKRTDALGRITSSVRDANSLPTQITRPNGAVLSRTYDERGNLLTSTEQAISATTTLIYEPNFNQVTSITDPKGNVTATTYDANGNPTEITDALGNKTQMTYDSRGLLTTVISGVGTPEVNTTTFTHTTLTYDSAGNVQTSIDAEGRVTTFTYDAMNRLTSVVDPLGGTTSYTFDANGNLLTVTDAKGQVTTFAYGSRDRLASSTDPLVNPQTNTYDENGNLTSTTTRKGDTITFAYDAANRLVTKTLPGPEATTFTYDVSDNLTSVVDLDGTVAMTYDLVNRLTSSAQSTPASPTPFSISYTHDLNGNRATMTDPQSGVTDYVYDSLNRLTSFTNPSAQATNFTYDTLSRRASMTHDNAVVSTYNYDAASQLLNLDHQLAATTINAFTYTYDMVGNRETRVDNNGTANYTYDALNRLVNAANPIPTNPTETYTYDPVGNRTDSNQNGLSNFNAGNQLTDDADFTYDYDANGNQIQKTDKVTGAFSLFEYDAENKLIRVVRDDGSLVNYKYGGLGRRIEKEVDTVVTRYIYDNEDILLELDGSNNLIVRYTHGPGIDEPLIMKKGGASFFYHADGLGSVTEITDNVGTVVQAYTHSSFGKIESQLDPNFVQPYIFTGREFDPETGLYHYRARAYDPSIGRFMEEDPLPGFIALPETLNLYPYVANNPVNFVDPNGRSLRRVCRFLSRFLKGKLQIIVLVCQVLSDSGPGPGPPKGPPPKIPPSSAPKKGPPVVVPPIPPTGGEQGEKEPQGGEPCLPPNPPPPGQD